MHYYFCVLFGTSKSFGDRLKSAARNRAPDEAVDNRRSLTQRRRQRQRSSSPLTQPPPPDRERGGWPLSFRRPSPGSGTGRDTPMSHADGRHRLHVVDAATSHARQTALTPTALTPLTERSPEGELEVQRTSRREPSPVQRESAEFDKLAPVRTALSSRAMTPPLWGLSPEFLNLLDSNHLNVKWFSSSELPIKQSACLRGPKALAPFHFTDAKGCQGGFLRCHVKQTEGFLQIEKLKDPCPKKSPTNPQTLFANRPKTIHPFSLRCACGWAECSPNHTRATGDNRRACGFPVTVERKLPEKPRQAPRSQSWIVRDGS